MPNEANEFEFPEKLSFLLFESARLKIAWGGRGAGKTENYTIALILLSRTKRLRILCGREFQNSIDESVKQTIEANIESMGFSDEFTITGKQIINKKTGSRFFFMGLRYNINKVKSLGRIDICWIEEADKTSKTTLDKLFPTIRGRSAYEADQGGPFGKGPEIWLSFNPDLEEDEVYKRYILNRAKYAPDYILIDHANDDSPVLNKDGTLTIPDPTKDYGNGIEVVRYAIVQKVNYWDNKWFPPDLRMEMSVLKAADETKYLEVWEGHTKQVLEGAIYADELRQVLKDGRRGKVPYDPSRPVYTFWDLGHSDKTAIWFVQRIGLEYNIINYYQNNLKKLGHYLEYMQSLGYVYGTVYQPHDADNETLASRSISKMTRDAGYKVIVVPRPAKKLLGINAVRTIMPLCNFDEANTSEGWQCLAHYAYKVDPDTGAFSREPEHDTPWSHGCFTGDTKILTRKGVEAISTSDEQGEVLTLCGWKKYTNRQLTRKNAKLVEVTFANGHVVKCTPDHLFLTETGWKFAENLETGLSIQSSLMTEYNCSKDTNTFYTRKNDISKVIKVTCIDMFGKTLLEKYQKIAMFIIRMKSENIATCKILNSWTPLSTCLIPVNANAKMEELFGLGRTFTRKLPNGINQKKARLGIEKIQTEYQTDFQKYVSVATLSLKGQTFKSSAALIVKSSLVSLVDQTRLELNGSKTRFVRTVDFLLSFLFKEVPTTKSSAQQNVGKLIIKGVRALNETEDVYCLTVPDVGHFSLANGAIVKNCDALQTMSLAFRTETDSKKPKKAAEVREFTRSGNSWMGSL